VKTLFETKRTVKIHIGLGSLPDNEFKAFDYSKNVIMMYNDKNYTNYNDAHP